MEKTRIAMVPLINDLKRKCFTGSSKANGASARDKHYPKRRAVTERTTTATVLLMRMSPTMEKFVTPVVKGFANQVSPNVLMERSYANPKKQPRQRSAGTILMTTATGELMRVVSLFLLAQGPRGIRTVGVLPKHN